MDDVIGRYSINKRWAYFDNIEIENSYLMSEFKHFSSRSILILLLMSISTLFFIRSDYIFFGTSSIFYNILFLRILYSIFSLSLIVYLMLRKDLIFFERLLPFWVIVTLIVATMINISRPLGYNFNAVIDVFFVIVVYIFLPINLKIRYFSCITYSIISIIIFFIVRTGLLDLHFNVIMVSFISVNLIGIFFSRNSELNRRQKFYLLEQEKKFKDEINQYSHELERANQDLDAYARAVAHDIRSPIGVINGYLSMITEKISRKSLDIESIKKHITMVQSSSQRIESIVDGLLQLAIMRKDESLILEEVNIEEIMEDVISQYQKSIDERKIEIVKGDYWPFVLGQDRMLYQIFSNFLSNSLKYGGLQPKIFIGCNNEDENFCRITFEDSGPGITDEMKEKVFDEFVRTSPEKADGIGIGLSIVKRLTNAMGGECGVEDSSLGGASFWVTLEIARVKTIV